MSMIRCARSETVRYLCLPECPRRPCGRPRVELEELREVRAVCLSSRPCISWNAPPQPAGPDALVRQSTSVQDCVYAC